MFGEVRVGILPLPPPPPPSGHLTCPGAWRGRGANPYEGGGGGVNPCKGWKGGCSPRTSFIPQTADLTGSVRLLEARGRGCPAHQRREGGGGKGSTCVSTGLTYVGIYIMAISVLGECAK
jgi:hypothetical protein